jgi:Fe-Mn family superoxide dismutase
MKFSITILFSLLGIIGISQTYSLPKLKYSYSALSASIDSTTMEIHYTKHHQAYITNLNKAIVANKLENISLEELLLTAGTRPDVIRNNAGGHYNHSLFWELLTPTQNTKPSPLLLRAIENQFSTLDSLKKLINVAASSRFGSGWAWLVVTPDHQLAVTSTANQDNPIMDICPIKGIPVLGIDVWEHAYYLKYQNKRGDYLSAIWNIIDWETISRKYEAALTDPLLLKLEKK